MASTGLGATPQGAGAFPPRAARLAPEQFARLFENCRPERVSPGHDLFIQDDPATRVYGVVSGVVEISIYSEEGRRLVANIEGADSLVGEIGALDGGPRTATATARGPCELVSLPRRQFLERVETVPGLAMAVIALLCARLRWVSGEFGDRAFLEIEARLAKRLGFLSNTVADAEGWVAISQAELADFLGATRESVNKVLNGWRGEGLVELRRGSLRVMRPARLAALAEDP